MPWGDILKVTKVGIDNSHPNTSQKRVWQHFIWRTMEWGEGKVDYIDFTKGIVRKLATPQLGVIPVKRLSDRKSMAMKRLYESLGKEHKQGVNQPLARLSCIKRISDLMKIDGSRARFFDEVYYEIWPETRQHVEPESIWSKD